MQVQPIKNNRINKAQSFGMKMTPDTLKLVMEAELPKGARNMVNDLLKNKDLFTLKISKDANGEFLPGLKHDEYKHARHQFPLFNDSAYSKFKELEEHPLVRLFKKDPTEPHEETKNGLVITYPDVNYRSLTDVVDGIYREMFSGEKFQRFVSQVLAPSHTQNGKIVREASTEYEEISNELNAGLKSGKIDEKAVSAVKKVIDDAYEGGKLTLEHRPFIPFCCNNFPKNAQYINKLNQGWYKECVQRLLGTNPAYHSKRTDGLVITAKNNGELYTYKPEDPKKLELLVGGKYTDLGSSIKGHPSDVFGSILNY